MNIILINSLILLIGLVLLIKGSDFFVEGASDIAKTLKIPSLVIGLTIVAFGTSAPEAAVSISASIKGSAGVSLGNVIGSNIFNLLMVTGVTACMSKIIVEKDVIKRDYPFNILISLAIIFVCLDKAIDNTSAIIVSRTDGLMLLCLFSVFMFYTAFGAISARGEMEIQKPVRKPLISVLMLIGGIIAVVGGGQLTVDSACNIARKLGVGENMIALTIIAIGTSLPELVTSVTALKKGESDIAIGNVIGSNIFNILFIVGISAAIKPMITDVSSVIDQLILLAVTIIVYGFILKNKSIGRKSGISFIAIYIAFSAYVILRGIA